MSRTNRRNQTGRRQPTGHRRLTVRAVRRDPVDIAKLSRALIQMALEEAAAAAAAQQQAVDTSTDSADLPTPGDGDA